MLSKLLPKRQFKTGFITWLHPFFVRIFVNTTVSGSSLPLNRSFGSILLCHLELLCLAPSAGSLPSCSSLRNSISKHEE